MLLESSGEEDDSPAVADDESDSGGAVTLGRDIKKPISLFEDEELEVDLDEDNFEDLDAQAAAYAKEHGDEEEVSGANRTRRLAVVNLDWDHVRAIHLYKIFSSYVSPSVPDTASGYRLLGSKDRTGTASRVVRGKILSVRVYPSQFGKERLAREDKEGPPTVLFKENDGEGEEPGLHEVGNGEDYNEEALRKYQLDRLRCAQCWTLCYAASNAVCRYYYAIVECDSVGTASHLYNELEGTELERSANVFDLSFVPDDMSFDAEFR